MVNPNGKPGYEYSEKDWNSVTEEEAVQNPTNTYRASKTFAERAAWEFVEREKPNFTLTTVDLLLTLNVMYYGDADQGL